MADPSEMLANVGAEGGKVGAGAVLLLLLQRVFRRSDAADAATEARFRALEERINEGLKAHARERDADHDTLTRLDERVKIHLDGHE